jgi:AraC family transcriptional activator of pobA
MKNDARKLEKFESLSQAHRAMGLPQPKHPLISMIGSAVNPDAAGPGPRQHVLSFYKISYKTQLGGQLRYGQGHYDFNEGGLLFAAPNQIIGAGSEEDAGQCSRYTLLIHPDFLLNYPIARKIRQYGFFSYSANEALHLSEEEKETVLSIFTMLESELAGRIDDFSQDVVIAQLELLLSYANRFYKRQFITRKAVSNDLLQRMDALLDEYFERAVSLSKGLPTVHYLAEQLSLSPSYLSDMLRSLTGQNAQQHIHHKLIEKAKEKLSATSMSVSEVAYELGFGHPQSFSKLFKTKTKRSPLEFRALFN